MIRIILIDDFAPLRRLVRILLEKEADFTVVGEAGDGDKGVMLATAMRPDILISDLSMPRLSGIEVITRTAESSPGTRIIILSGHIAESWVCDALDAGAMGYVAKESATETLVSAVREVLADHRYLALPSPRPRLKRIKGQPNL